MTTATKLTVHQQRLVLAKHYKNQAKLSQLFGNLLNQIVLLEGKKGKGKSLSTIAIAWQMRELFKKPVIIVGTKVGVTERFGPFTFLSERQFIEQLDKLSDVSNDIPEGEEETAINRALRSMGIDIMNATIVFDEAVKLFDARTPSDKLVRLFGYFVSQSRHYHITIIITIPNRDNLDKRVRRQIDWFGRCTTTCRYSQISKSCARPKCPHRTTVRFVGGLDRFKLSIYGPNFWDKYNSWQMVGFRGSQTSIVKI